MSIALCPTISLRDKYDSEKTPTERNYAQGNVHNHVKKNKKDLDHPIITKVLYIAPERRNEFSLSYDRLRGVWMRGQQPMSKNTQMSFVLTPERQMYAYTDKDIEDFQNKYYSADVTFKHSSLIGGKDVIFAGEGSITDDNTLAYSDQSGHYRATENQPHFQAHLDAQGASEKSRYKAYESLRKEKTEHKAKVKIPIPTFQNELPAAGMGPPSLS